MVHTAAHRYPMVQKPNQLPSVNTDATAICNTPRVSSCQQRDAVLVCSSTIHVRKTIRCVPASNFPSGLLPKNSFVATASAMKPKTEDRVSDMPCGRLFRLGPIRSHHA